uniref:Uncharacterized protein n=1 Tax=viral metagenome TaxID=1070528 RepID=A0A6C0E7V5_9ZZZZ
MLTIYLEEPITKHQNPIYYKTTSRLATITDVNIVSDNLVVAIHRYAGKVYLIEIDNNLENYNIIDTLNVKYADNKIDTEMLVRKDTHLYIITFSEYMIQVDIINNKKLQFIRTIKLNEKGNRYHGVCVYNNNLYMVPSVVPKNNPIHIIKMGIPLSDNNNNKVEKIITKEFIDNTGKYRIKDIAFLKNGTIVLNVMINNGKTIMTMENHVDNGFIGLYDSHFNQLDVYLLDEVHLDGMVAYENDVYFTVVEKDGSFIYKCSIDDITNKIDKNVKKYKSADFPHGIDIYKSSKTILGYTSYGTSSLYLSYLDDMEFVLV